MPFKIKVIFLANLFVGGLFGQTLPEGFVFLKEHIPDLEVTLRYATSDNFMGRVVNGYLPNQKVVGTVLLAQALKKAQLKLKKEGLGIKIFDAYRPQRAVDHFVQWSQYPKDTLTKSKYYPQLPKDRLFELGYIAKKSGHSRGSTVDLTLVYLTGKNQGKVLDMGGDWDYFGKRSHYDFKPLNRLQKENRKRLREVMRAVGFKPYEKEWWHFTLSQEPFPNDYFDFVP
ncbi:M15 family metallopeptidase [Flavobacteriaceae bacterium]|jgi:D-alanyl-D-alanine dipeptidase|nr:M15 family metallopeptidase [Flavobacteriaceae bacterium]MDC0386650.1 M15 family metallopeptidase [Flavobacteriaceae bacterium]